jgi:hypothetical protein
MTIAWLQRLGEVFHNTQETLNNMLAVLRTLGIVLGRIEVLAIHAVAVFLLLRHMLAILNH